MKLSEDEKVLIIAGGDGVIRGWSLSDEKYLYSFKAHKQAAWQALELKNKQIVTLGTDGYLRVWEPEKAKKVFEAFIDRDAKVIALSPDGSMIATGVATIRIWNTKKWQEVPFITPKN